MEHKVAPDVLVRNEGIVFCPLTSEAKEWIDEHVQPDAQWFGNPDRRAQVRVGLGQGMKDPGPSDGVRRGENDNQ